MSQIVCSRREMERAFRLHYTFFINFKKAAFDSGKQSALLLLFYATECGLKAAWMIRCKHESTDKCDPIFNTFLHNINRILDELRVNPKLRLPNGTISKSPPRTVQSFQLNQALRYGCLLDNENDIEQRLIEIIEWLKGEL